MTEQATLERPQAPIDDRARAGPEGDLIACPSCHRMAEVVDRFDLESTDGPVPHVRLRCVPGRHHLMMPA
jgi:hypothetical protein